MRKHTLQWRMEGNSKHRKSLKTYESHVSWQFLSVILNGYHLFKKKVLWFGYQKQKHIHDFKDISRKWGNKTALSFDLFYDISNALKAFKLQNYPRSINITKELLSLAVMESREISNCANFVTEWEIVLFGVSWHLIIFLYILACEHLLGTFKSLIYQYEQNGIISNEWGKTPTLSNDEDLRACNWMLCLFWLLAHLLQNLTKVFCLFGTTLRMKGRWNAEARAEDTTTLPVDCRRWCWWKVKFCTL